MYGGGDRVPFPKATGFSALISMFDFSPCVVHTFAPQFSLFLSLIFSLKTLNLNVNIREVGESCGFSKPESGVPTYLFYFVCVCRERDKEPIEI